MDDKYTNEQMNTELVDAQLPKSHVHNYKIAGDERQYVQMCVTGGCDSVLDENGDVIQ